MWSFGPQKIGSVCGPNIFEVNDRQSDIEEGYETDYIMKHEEQGSASDLISKVPSCRNSTFGHMMVVIQQAF